MRRSALLAMALAMLLPACALARRRATKHERAGVVAAALNAGDIGRQQAPCVVVYVSTVDHAWASLGFPAKPSRACEPYQANGVSVYHHARSGGWHWVTAGDEFRCPIHGVPTRVAHDLKLC